MSVENNKIIVLWDGDCRFCQQSLAWLKKQNLKGNIKYLSFHDEEAKEYKKKIGEENLRKSMVVVVNNVDFFSQAEALRLLFNQSNKWRWLGFLMGLPILRQCCNLGYRIISNYRYQLSKHSCKLN